MKTNDYVKFTGVKIGFFWFADVLENGKKLTIGRIYTISNVFVNPSWTAVTLKETGDLKYNSVWFEEV